MYVGFFFQDLIGPDIKTTVGNPKYFICNI